MDELEESSEMARTGSFACLSKQTISSALECILSCIIFVGAIYIFLIILSFIPHATKVAAILLTVGYISLIILISAPIGLYGTEKSCYWALFTYYILASYHLYALIIYLWFNIRGSSSSSSLVSNEVDTASHKDQLVELALHQVTTGAYIMLVCFSLILVVFRIISTTLQIEPAKVIVVDNNPLD